MNENTTFTQACRCLSSDPPQIVTGELLSSPMVHRVRGLPPTCEIELRPYAKVGRKKARDVLGCARVPESDNPDLDSGVFHKFLKMDFSEVVPSEDRDLAEASPSLLVSVYTRVGEKKTVSGRAEILLASLCGYKNLCGEAVFRRRHHHRGAAVDHNNTSTRHKHTTTAGSTLPAVVHGSGDERVFGFDGAEAFSCPVAAVDKVIPLLGDRANTDGGKNGGGDNYCTGGRGGEIRLRALYVPDTLADALGVRSAIKVRTRTQYRC